MPGLKVTPQQSIKHAYIKTHGNESWPSKVGNSLYLNK